MKLTVNSHLAYLTKDHVKPLFVMVYFLIHILSIYYTIKGDE